MRLSVPHRLRILYRALAIKIFILAVVALSIPIVLYQLFREADAQQGALLQQTVEEKGTLIASVLRPRLLAFDDEPPDRLQQELNQLGASGANIRVLVRSDNTAGGFLYVASVPEASLNYLEQERAKFIELGIFARLAPSCDAGLNPTLRYTNPAGRPEILTSVSPLHFGTKCWIVITSQATDAILSSSIGQPVWRTPIIAVAGLVYLIGAALVVWVLADIWRNVDRFRMAARKIRTQAEGQVTFRELNTIPELTGVAEDFDSLVSALKRSKDFIIQAGEENAHALKAPLAVIAQALEPLKRAIPESHSQGWRSLEMIERSTSRLDLLVSAARDLEQTAADLISTNASTINVSDCLSHLISAYRATLDAEGKHLRSDIEPGVHVYATEEAIETITENLLENAASFTDEGGTIEVKLCRSEAGAQLTVSDSGPGVPEENMRLIFERHFSARDQSRVSSSGLITRDQHEGLGLWIVRRNIEGVGGRIAARNRDQGGFAVTASFRTV
jgi:two-component system, OmpR family, sensor histidine kinase ChvG